MKYRNLFYGTLTAVLFINLSCAQELTTADGLVIPGTCDAPTLRPCIAHIFPTCMVKVDALPEGSLPQSQNMGGIDMYVSLTSMPYMMEITVVSGTCEVMKWPEAESTIKKCVNSASMISRQEVEMLEKHGFVIGVDADNDFFVKAGYAVNPSTGKTIETIAGRYYFLKPSKSFRQTQSNSYEVKGQAAKFGNVSDGLIHTFFGYTIGSEIQDFRRARRLNDKTMRVKDTLKLKYPFQICKNVSLHYTPNGFRLFQIKLESDVFISPDLLKMKERLKEIADAIVSAMSALPNVPNRHFARNLPPRGV